MFFITGKFMENKKFTVPELERFNDKISNVLDNSCCREIFGRFLIMQRNPAIIKTLKLWEKAQAGSSYDENSYLDEIEDIDAFNINPLYSISECEHKLTYIKQECSRILEKIHPQFMLYLHKYHH